MPCGPARTWPSAAPPVRPSVASASPITSSGRRVSKLNGTDWTIFRVAVPDDFITAAIEAVAHAWLAKLYCHKIPPSGRSR